MSPNRQCVRCKYATFCLPVGLKAFGDRIIYCTVCKNYLLGYLMEFRASVGWLEAKKTIVRFVNRNAPLHVIELPYCMGPALMYTESHSSSWPTEKLLGGGDQCPVCYLKKLNQLKEEWEEEVLWKELVERTNA